MSVNNESDIVRPSPNGEDDTIVESQYDSDKVSNRWVECPECGHNELRITYYDHLASDRQCTSCFYIW